MDGLYIGLMSGTSADGIDAALVVFEGDQFALKGHHHQAFTAELQQRIHALADADVWPAQALGSLDVALGHAFADAALALLEQAQLAPSHIVAIGSHGQTLRHQPPSVSNTPFTCQIGDANVIAERTGIDTIADFRRRDLAAGGEGAPLAPGFHYWAWGRGRDSLAIANLGGISNLTLIGQQGQAVEGFDCGPANTLMDAWCQRHRQQPFDREGAWAASGQVCAPLLAQLLTHAYFQRQGPRSTGREAFNLGWLDQQLRQQPAIAAADVQATLCELAAVSLCQGLNPQPPGLLCLCGGGAYNRELVRRIQAHLPDWQVATTSELGLAPEQVEAVAFAWLAYQFTRRQSGNLPAVTGARHGRVLGALHPGI